MQVKVLRVGCGSARSGCGEVGRKEERVGGPMADDFNWPGKEA